MAPESQASFQQLDTKQRHLKTKKVRGDDDVEGPHLIRLAKGVVPDYIKLTPFQELSWRVMGNYAKSKDRTDDDLEENLLKAHMKIRPEEYVSFMYMSALITAIVSIVLAIVVITVFTFLDMFMIGLILGIMMPVLLPILVFFGLKSSPAGRAKKRGKDIDKRISGSMSFISAMASANVPVDMIFSELARQPVYGEIKSEAEWITRDTELLGIDILNAIKRGSQRSPSIKWSDFLQGVVTTSTSGGQLKPYFVMKAEEFEKEAKLELKSTMETLAMLAESFITVVVAFPLFLVVILAIMAIIGGNSENTTMILFMVICVMIPVSQFGFIFVIWDITRET